MRLDVLRGRWVGGAQAEIGIASPECSRVSAMELDMDLDRIVDSVKKTGFVLEYDVAELFRKHKWNVISGKHYLDDVQHKPREIDLIGYKAHEVRGVQYYTALVVSCKKREKGCFGFLVRERDPKDPNMDWHPVTTWSNDKALKFMLGQRDWKNRYIDDLRAQELYPDLLEPSGHVFAYREFERERKGKWKATNDHRIFDSLCSLMKAESYELGLLERRKRETVFYSFNLLSVVDGDMVKLEFASDGITPSVVQEMKCVANYIVNRREKASRVQFVTRDALDTWLGKYDSLHDRNVRFFSRMIMSFYANIFKNRDRVAHLQQEFDKKVLWWLDYICKKEFPGCREISYVTFVVDESHQTLEVGLPLEEEQLEFLNSNDSARQTVKDALESVYRFTGVFSFAVADVPF